jgi:hypothetical protein
MSPIAWIQDLIADFLAWLFPGKIGKAVAIIVTGVVFVGLMYVVNYRAISRLFY